jgi:carbon-monoxide dehydrogenase small subunit
MAADEKDRKRLSRRNFLKGAGAGAAVAAVAVGGVEEYRLISLAPPVAPPAVTASLSASPVTIQAGGSVTFSATPGGGTAPYTLSISCGDGTTLAAAGAHSYASQGAYTALLTVTDSNGSKAYATTSILVNALPPPLTYTKAITLNVNGIDQQMVVDNRVALREVIRDKLGLTGTKNGCDGKGECGACTVLANGKPVLSCLVLAVEAEGLKITTVEGLANPLTGALDPVQDAFLQNDGMQCGYCTPGFIMLTKGILAETPHPTQQQAMEAISGNLCRCAGYPKILKSVLASGGSS